MVKQPNDQEVQRGQRLLQTEARHIKVSSLFSLSNTHTCTHSLHLGLLMWVSVLLCFRDRKYVTVKLPTGDWEEGDQSLVLRAG